MFCPQCGNQIPDESRYCAKCGTRITPTSGAEQPTATSYSNVSKNNVKKPKKKRRFLKLLLLVILVVAILCFAIDFFRDDSYYPSDYDSSYAPDPSYTDNSTEYSNSSDSSQDPDIPALPNPCLALDDAEVTLQENIDVNLGNVEYTFDEYTFDFTPPSNLVDNSAIIAYKLLTQNRGFELILDYSEGSFSQYAIVWEDEYLAGILLTDRNQWVVYVFEAIGIDFDSESSSSGSYQNESYDLSSSGGTYQNKSYFDGSYYVGGSPEYADGQRCKACDGSGKCGGCHGDGLFNNPYLGGGNTSECNLCDDGRCDVCGGDGYYP